VSKTEDTRNLHVLETELLSGTEDTDSLPILQGEQTKSPQRGKGEAHGHFEAARAHDLDWLISITTTLDKRLERIEEALNRIQIVLAEVQEKKGALRKLFASLLPRQSG
jgi:hypothetical protein